MLHYIVLVLYSFALTVMLMPFLISFLKKRGITGIDKHKKSGKEVPELGGIGILAVFLVNILIVTIMQQTIFHGISAPVLLFSALAVLIAGIVGLLDYVLKLIDLQKVFLPLLAAIPLILLQPASTYIALPFLGEINAGWLVYYLILLPLAFTGATNAVNMLAGLNGLEIGNGVVIISGLSALALLSGRLDALVIGLCALGPMLGALFFNKYPAKIFPGDVGTFTIGAVVAVIAILAKLEFFAMIMILPQFIEFFLKLKSRFKAENFGELVGNILHPPYKSSYSLTHIFYKEKKFDEPTIVYKLWALQAVFVIFAIGLYQWGGLF